MNTHSIMSRFYLITIKTARNILMILFGNVIINKIIRYHLFFYRNSQNTVSLLGHC